MCLEKWRTTEPYITNFKTHLNLTNGKQRRSGNLNYQRTNVFFSSAEINGISQAYYIFIVCTNECWIQIAWESLIFLNEKKRIFAWHAIQIQCINRVFLLQHSTSHFDLNLNSCLISKFYDFLSIWCWSFKQMCRVQTQLLPIIFLWNKRLIRSDLDLAINLIKLKFNT